MKVILPILFALVIWVALFKLFFDDSEDFWETAKENSFWFAVAMLFDTAFGGVRFLIFAAVGIMGGALLYNFL